MKFRLPHCALLAALAAPGLAELRFASTRLELPAAPGADHLHGEFEFRNAGPAPVTIVALQTACGCTAVAVAKKTYAPGESGRISADFEVGERTGPQSKAVMVQTDEPRDNVYPLTVATDIPVVLALEPRLLVWKRGGPADFQAVKVRLAPGRSYRLVAAKDDGGRFVAEAALGATVTADTEIRIRPRATDAEVLGVMMLDFAGADGSRLQRTVLMRVAVFP